MRVEILGDERRRRWGDERKLEIVLRHRLLEVADRCGLVLGLIVQVRVAGIIRDRESACGAGHKGHPPCNPQAVWRRGEDPHCA